MWIAACLSEKRGTCRIGEIERSDKRRTSQVISATTRRSFGGGQRNRRLFLGFPRNGTATKADEISTNIATRVRARAPIRVTKSKKIKKKKVFKKIPKPGSDKR